MLTRLIVLFVSHDQAIVANRTVSVAIALATACLGGIFTSTATDMGAKVSLFEVQAQVSLLNCAAGYSRPLWTSNAQVHFLRNRGRIRWKDYRHAPQDQGDRQ
jgi:hypothetical protein